MNECKECKTKLVCVGKHEEAPDYNKWICPNPNCKYFEENKQ
jgi:hypothetical protein